MTGTLDVSPASERRVRRPAPSNIHSSHSLAPELMAEATRRLGWLGLVYGVATIVEHVGRRAVLVFTGSAAAGLGISDVFGIAAALMGLAVYALSRTGVLSSKRLLDLGLVFQVVGAFGIAAGGAFEVRPTTPIGLFGFVPAECIWIVAYPLVVPNIPRRVLIASLLAASMGPAVLVLATVARGTGLERPVDWGTYFLLTNYLSAAVAYVVSRIVHRTGLRLKHLRDIGSYELVEPIGEGGMGEVWRAQHRLLARPAAIKLIRGDALGSSERTRDAMVRRFELEAHATATLRSVHTVDVYDFGVTEDGDFYYVMELLDGLSLERFVRTFGPMEPTRVVYMLRQVVHSLGEAHARGLLHRDIKPANIFMCRLGPDDDFVKVLDFGLVKDFETPGATMLTMDGSAAGTPAYMAPEIALGRRDVDGRADIYSLGCVAYYLLTGQPVFAGNTPVATALAQVNETPVPPSERSEFRIPPTLETLILECLAKDPALRPLSAAELDRRIASVFPDEAWTPAAAHAWWELHHPQLASDAAAAPKAPAVATRAGHRCRPRFDRKTTKVS